MDATIAERISQRLCAAEPSNECSMIHSASTLSNIAHHSNMICSVLPCDLRYVDDDDLDSAGGRLAWARKRAGYSDKADFARSAKVKPVTYRAYEANQNGFAKLAPHFARLLGVTAEWLIDGGPIPEIDVPIPPPAGEFGTPQVLVDHDIELVRQVDISYAMGDGSVVEDYPETRFLPFDRQFLRTLTRAPNDRVFIATGQGDSMFPTLLRDDIVLVDTTRNRLTEQDRIWALTYAGAGMIKRLRSVPGKILILSDNPNVPPQEADPEDVHIVGKVIWIGRQM